MISRVTLTRNRDLNHIWHTILRCVCIFTVVLLKVSRENDLPAECNCELFFLHKEALTRNYSHAGRKCGIGGLQDKCIYYA